MEDKLLISNVLIGKPNNLFRSSVHLEDVPVEIEPKKVATNCADISQLWLTTYIFHITRVSFRNVGVLCSSTVQTCDTPREPSYGKATPELRSKYFFGNIVKYQCNNGFSIRGHKTTRCQIYGNWSNPVPTCVSKFRFSPRLTSCVPTQTDREIKCRLRELEFEFEMGRTAQSSLS